MFAMFHVFIAMSCWWRFWRANLCYWLWFGLWSL